MKVPGLLSYVSTSTLCRRDVPVKNAKDVIGWWETRRIPFNLIVGTAGIITCIVIGVVGSVAYFLFDSEFGFPDPPIFALVGVVLYGIFANVCFSGGWLAELIVRKLWPSEADRFSTLSLSLGLIFSVVLTLAPAIVIGVAGVFALIGHVSGVTHLRAPP